MNTAKRGERNAAIFAARAKGFGWARIAADTGITERHAQRVYREYREQQPSLHSLDPVSAVEEVLDGYDSASQQLAELADGTRHDGVRLGAIRARVDLLAKRMDLLMAVGVLPQDLGKVWDEVDARRTADDVFSVLERHGVPNVVFEDLLEALGGPLPEHSLNGSSAES